MNRKDSNALPIVCVTAIACTAMVICFMLYLLHDREAGTGAAGVGDSRRAALSGQPAGIAAGTSAHRRTFPG